jgi:hypothetical protein
MMFASLLGMSLMAGSAMAAVRFGVGVNIGVHAPVYVAPAPVAFDAQPPCPGPGYVWIDGFNGPNGFVAGYWALPPFGGANWVAPRFDGGRFVAGFWGGARVMDTHTNFTHTNFRAVPLNDHDGHFDGHDNRAANFNGRSNDRHDDHGRDFRR